VIWTHVLAVIAGLLAGIYLGYNLAEDGQYRNDQIGRGE